MKSSFNTLTYKYIIVLFICCTSNLTYSQDKFTGRTNGTYCKSEEYSSICLELRQDSTYKYSTGTDTQTWYSVGKWAKKKDTIILNSFIQANNLPITIEEIVSNNSNPLITFPLPEDLSGNLIKDISIFINYDTTEYCMPAFDNDCNFLKEKVNSIKIALSDGISSKWYKINSSKPDTIKIKIDVTYNLGLFIFLNNEKFLFDKHSIIPLEQSDKDKSGLKYERMKYVLRKEY